MSSSGDKNRPPLSNIPGVDVIAHAHHRASRKISAVQRTPVGRRILNFMRNVVWVVPLTILVWLYAEREQLDDVRGMSVPITVFSERPDRVVSVIRPEDRAVTIDIKGTRARIEEARQELTGKQGIQIPVPAGTATGAQVQFPITEAIATHPIFADRGIIVTACNPAAMTLKVDEMTEIQVRPEISSEIASRLDGAVVFDPPMVKVTGPRSVLMNPKEPPKVIAELIEQMLPTVAGEQEIPGISVHLREPNDQVKIAPATVKAIVRVRSSTVSFQLSSVPVFPMGPQALLDKYRVVFPSGPYIPRVTVIGPEDEINRIKSNEFLPKAVLEIKQEDVRERLPRAPTMYILPPNVTVSEEDRTRTITFELEERAVLE